VLKAFKVSTQRTLHAFKGGRGTGRSVADITSAGIEALFKMAMN
jgi:hypothetical protein